MRSADGVDETQTFPNSSTLESVFFSFGLTDDLVGGEDVETYIASLEIVGNSTVQLNSQSTTQVFVKDNDGMFVCSIPDYLLFSSEEIYEPHHVHHSFY